jgi:hypothetical protein
VRAIAALGALSFAYLAVIPAALVGATIDPGCGSSCGYSTPVEVYLVIGFALCALALAGSALSLAAYAFQPSHSTGSLVRRWLRISAATIGALLFSEFAVIHPIAAAVIAAVSLPAGWLITGRGDPRRFRPVTRR